MELLRDNNILWKDRLYGRLFRASMTSSSTWVKPTAFATALMLLTSWGCGPRARAWTPAESPDALSDTAFLHYLATVPIASVDDAARALLMVVDGHAAATPAARLGDITQRGWIDAHWRAQSDHVLTRGVAASMLSRACKLPEGLNARLSRITNVGRQRYAIRACADAKLLSYGTVDQTISGGELLSAISAADAYVQAHSP